MRIRPVSSRFIARNSKAGNLPLSHGVGDGHGTTGMAIIGRAVSLDQDRSQVRNRLAAGGGSTGPGQTQLTLHLGSELEGQHTGKVNEPRLADRGLSAAEDRFYLFLHCSIRPAGKRSRIGLG